MSKIGNILSSVTELGWPRTCHLCGASLAAHEDYLCMSCLQALPRVPYSYAGVSDRMQLTRNLKHCHAWLYYGRHEPVAQLLQDIKYRGCNKLAQHIGKCMAWDLAGTSIFNGVDCIVPVPLHFLRRMKRGYNQSSEIAKGLASVMSVPVVEALKARWHKTQTGLSPAGRASNVQGVYFLNMNRPLSDYSHAMLVDDVCTTGSTLVHCAEAIHKGYPNLDISVLTLAMAQ